VASILTFSLAFHLAFFLPYVLAYVLAEEKNRAKYVALKKDVFLEMRMI